MNSTRIVTIVLILLAVIFVVLAIAPQTEDHQSEYQKLSYTNALDLEDEDISETEIKMNAGTLELTTHTQHSVVLKANYTRESWKPEMKFNKLASLLSIHQPNQKSSNMNEDDDNDWQIKFPKNLETNLKLTIGAGEGIVDLAGSKINTMVVEAGAGDFDINLANTSLSNLNINAGVGELTLDLSGEQRNDLRGKINGGVGSMKVILPLKTGIKIKVNAGLGNIDAHDLKKQDGYYVNELYGQTPKSIEMEINGGLGSLELELK